MAWSQQKFNEYMAAVRECNQHYERFRKSRIHTFTGMLKMKRFQESRPYLQRIEAEWNKVPADAQRLYAPAWEFVRAELFPAGARPPVGAVGLPGMQGGLGAVAAQRARARNVRVAQSAIQVNEDVSQRLDGVEYRWTVRFSIQPTAGGKQGQCLIVQIPIAAFGGDSAQHRAAMGTGLTAGIPDDHVGRPLDDKVKRNWSSRIAERWGGGVFVVKDRVGDDLETYDIEFKIDFVTNPSMASQIVFAVKSTGTAPPDGTVNTMYWGVDDGGTKGAAIAHEFGHLIGNPDEYGNCTFNGKNNARDATSVMDNETTGQAKVRHLFMVGTHAARGLGHAPADCAVRLNAAEHPVLNNHPW